MKSLNEAGYEEVDGRPIENYEGKVVNPFYIEPDEGVTISDGDRITLLVTVRTETPKFSSVKKTGQVKKQIQFRSEDARILDPDKAKMLYDLLGAEVYGVNEGLVEVSFIPSPEEKDLGFNPEDAKL